MKRTGWATGLAIAATCTIGLAAQTSSTPTSTSGQTITVTGCLESTSASTSSSGTTGSGTAASGSASMPQFVLANATMGTPSSGSTGTSGTTGAASSSSSMGSKYVLDGKSSELQPHAGHQIEVTGTLDTTSGSTSGATSGTATGTTGTTGSGSATSSPQRLKVSSVRMISATCPSK